MFDLRSIAMKLVFLSKPDFLIKLVKMFVTFATAPRGIIPVNAVSVVKVMNFLLLSI
jgi:hypothetical protein